MSREQRRRGLAVGPRRTDRAIVRGPCERWRGRLDHDGEAALKSGFVRGEDARVLELVAAIGPSGRRIGETREDVLLRDGVEGMKPPGALGQRDRRPAVGRRTSGDDIGTPVSAAVGFGRVGTVHVVRLSTFVLHASAAEVAHPCPAGIALRQSNSSLKAAALYCAAKYLHKKSASPSVPPSAPASSAQTSAADGSVLQMLPAPSKLASGESSGKQVTPPSDASPTTLASRDWDASHRSMRRDRAPRRAIENRPRRASGASRSGASSGGGSTSRAAGPRDAAGPGTRRSRWVGAGLDGTSGQRAQSQ